MDTLFISISGIIGAGKTTLTTALGEVMSLPVHYEGVIDNIYLSDFYKDMKKYSFPLQIYLLNKRFQQHQKIVWMGKGGVQDRTIYEDSIFAKMLMEQGNIEKRDYDTYLELFSNMSNFMRKPNLIVHLDVKPETSLKRIKERSRNCETSITLDYLKDLYTAYEKFITSISKEIPVIRVDWNTYRDPKEIANEIKVYCNTNKIKKI